MARHTAPESFTINVSDALLTDLRERLDRVRWPGEIPDTGWDYGTNLAYLKELVTYWRTQYDWRAQEAFINSFANYRAEVDGVLIHFIYERGRGPDPMPSSRTGGRAPSTSSGR